MGDDAARLRLEIGDDVLVLHFEHGALGQDPAPMRHQIRIASIVAPEFAEIIAEC